MKALIRFCVVPLLAACSIQSSALSLAPEEFNASRQMACVLAKQELGQLSENEYGQRTHTVLDGFDEAERDNILAQAIGFYGGLLFSETANNIEEKAALRLEQFVSSSTCAGDFHAVTLSL
jgi:hypothetical protein